MIGDGVVEEVVDFGRSHAVCDRRSSLLSALLWIEVRLWEESTPGIQIQLEIRDG